MHWPGELDEHSWCNAHEKGRRKWMDFPHFTTFLLNALVKPPQYIGESTHFAYRTESRIGSADPIIVDLQTHKMLDVLPDRTAETSAAWMAAHPELDIVSRDRGGDYAAAARTAAPQATQTADRFHLMNNLTEAVELTLARCRAEIRKAAYDALPEEERKVVDPLTLPLEPVALENWKPTPDPCTERERLARQAERQDRFEPLPSALSRPIRQSDSR